MVSRREIREFVVDAHRNGYATTESNEASTLGGTLIEYGDGDWEYVDRYFGSRTFVGFEVVLHDDRPVWGMSYHGSPTDSGVDHAELYAFLRSALERASPANPYRGPDTFEIDGVTYRADTDGTIERFTGVEVVERDDSVIYRGEYGGGLVD